MEILSKGKSDTVVKLFNHSKMKNSEKSAIASSVKPTAVGGMSRAAVCSLMSLELHVSVYSRQGDLHLRFMFRLAVCFKP